MVLLAFAATWRAWADAWSLVDVAGDNSHVLLAPLVIAWLAWARRGRLPYIRVSGRWLGPPIVAIGWAVGAAGLAGNVTAAFHLGSLMAVIGALVTAMGKGVVTRMVPVAFATLFLIPVPQLVRQWMAVPLQTTTALIADGVLDAVGVNSRVMGNTLVVNGKSVMIAEACNGMPMVFGLVLVTYAFVFAWPMRNGVRWALLLLAPFVTLACNVVRTVPLVWTYAHRSAELANWLHTWSGWLMLPVGFVVLLGVVRALRWFDVPVERYRLAAQ